MHDLEYSTYLPKPPRPPLPPGDLPPPNLPPLPRPLIVCTNLLNLIHATRDYGKLFSLNKLRLALCLQVISFFAKIDKQQ